MRARDFGIVVWLLAAVPASASQQAAQAPAPAAPAVATAAASSKVWIDRNTEFEAYLRTADFRRFENVPIGVTRPQRGFFDPGGLASSAAWKLLPPGRSSGYWESYKSEIAAYELDKLLGLNMVPPAVEKRHRGERGAAILWVEGVHPWKEVEHLPKPPKWNLEAVRMKMFDNLIGNIDRNAGNLIVDDDWNLYLIDHSRAFVTDTRLRIEMARIDRALWNRMLALDEPALTAALGPWLDRGAIRAILKRRDAMKRAIETLLKERPEALVFIGKDEG
jgi:hypothetical protein